jgi:transcription termination/antitermination protein NusG
VDKESSDTPREFESETAEKEHGQTRSDNESSAKPDGEAQEQALTDAEGEQYYLPEEEKPAFGRQEEDRSSLESGAFKGSVALKNDAELKWYVVHVYSGFEQKVKVSLQERIKQAGMESYFGDILIPMETVQETRSGSTRVRAKTFYPGYIFVQMNLNDETWHVVRDTPKITGFVGGRYPRPVPPPEIMSVVQQVEEGAAKPRPTVVFEQGDHVRVIDGAFANFTGTVEEIKPEKLKVKVLVSIFGRATPVELDYSQVEKTA